jgi:hypothetical protein
MSKEPQSISRRKFAIYNPETGLFISNEESWNMNWTDRFDAILSYVNSENAIEIVRRLQTGKCPSARLVEATFTMSWEESDIALDIRSSPTYAKHKAVYDRFLPQYLLDAEAIPPRDWERFKASRGFLRTVGDDVEP